MHSNEPLVGKLQAAILRAQPLIRQLLPPLDDSGSSSTAADASEWGTCGGSGNSCGDSSSPAAAQGLAKVPVLLSGAGHDAMAIADITKIAMVFVRCAGGVSHNPAEHAAPRDVAAAAAAFATFMEMDLLDHAAHPDDSFAPVL